MSDDNMSSDVPTKIGEPPEIDEEIDEFAESAFDALMMDGEGKSSSEQPEAAGAAEDAESVTTATGEYEDVELQDRGIFATRQLAKRQLTWLRGMDDVQTVDCINEIEIKESTNQLVKLFLS